MNRTEQNKNLNVLFRSYVDDIWDVNVHITNIIN